MWTGLPPRPGNCRKGETRKRALCLAGRKTLNVAEDNPRPDRLAEADRLLGEAMDRDAEERVLLDRVRRVLSGAVTGGGRARRGRRYKLHFGGKGVGPTVALYRRDERRNWEQIGRFDGVAAVFLQRLTEAALSGIPCLPFQEVAELLLGGVPEGKKPLPKIAHQAVRTAFYRKLPPGVDRQDLVRSVRGFGYQLCEGVEVTGQVAGHWERPLLPILVGRGDIGEVTSNENVRQALEMLKEGQSFEDIQRDLELGDEAFEELKSQLQRLAEPGLARRWRSRRSAKSSNSDRFRQFPSARQRNSGLRKPRHPKR